MLQKRWSVSHQSLLFSFRHPILLRLGESRCKQPPSVLDDAKEKIANAKAVSPRPFTDFGTWAKANMATH